MLQQYEKVNISTSDCFKMYVLFFLLFHFCDTVWSFGMKTKMFSLLVYICILVGVILTSLTRPPFCGCTMPRPILLVPYLMVLFISILLMNVSAYVVVPLCTRVACVCVCVCVVLHVFITFTSTAPLLLTHCCSRFNNFHASPVVEMETITFPSELFGY
jgi:hypothetical protein